MPYDLYGGTNQQSRYQYSPVTPLPTPQPVPQPTYTPTYDINPYLAPVFSPEKPIATVGGDLSGIAQRLISYRQQQREADKNDTYNQGVVTTAVKPFGGGVSAYGWQGNTGMGNTRGKSPYGFQSPMWQALTRANEAMKADLGRGFSITDGWRSYQAQVDLKKKKPGLAATPGRSIHGLGLAADLNLDSKQKAWMRKNAARYGLYAPIFGKEPWHWQLQPNLWNGQWGV